MTLKEKLEAIWKRPGVCHPLHVAKWKLYIDGWVGPNTKYMRFRRSARKGVHL